MVEASVAHPELPNLVALLAHKLGSQTQLGGFLLRWENIIFSVFCALVIFSIAYAASRRMELVPLGRLQNAFESLIGPLDNFILGILGPGGRKYTPFIGTLFIYILLMNLLGLVPFMKSPTSNWSTTMGLALCVFFYVQYTGIRELGFLGYLDHMMGKPRGVLAFSVLIPLLMFFLHIVSELVRPLSLSLRLRGNIMGDDILLAVLAKMGLAGVPFLLFSTLLAIMASVIQAFVFTLLTTIYFSLVLAREE